MKKNLLFTILTLCCFTIGFSQADCANALALTPGTPQSGDSAGQPGDFDAGGAAPTNPCNANYNDDEYWFEYTAVTTGESLQLDMTNITQGWSGIFVMDNCPGATPNCVAEATENGTADYSVTTPSLTSGTSYKIVVANWGTPDNTAFTLTSTVIPAPTCLEVMNLNATPLSGDTSADLSWDAEAGATLGYNWAVMDAGGDPDVDTPVDANSTTMLTATAMGLTPGNGYDLYVQSNCDANGLSTWAGPFSFTSTAPPANDDFANASPIDCSSGTIMGSTSAATLDEDDAPDGGGADLDAPNVWFSLDSTVDGPSDVTLDLCASGYDTSVLVYTGTSGNLTFVAGNDDNTAASACGACCQSYLTFPTDGVSTYFITVEGYNPGSIGDFEMAVSCVTVTPPPANDDCGTAVPLSENVPVVGTTVGATTSPGDAPTCDTFGSIADVWYSVALTGGLSDLNVTTTLGTTSDQANVAVYDDCAALAANSLGCSDANGGETLDVNNLADGTYYIRVWSDGNAPPVSNPGRVEGEFTIVVNTTLSTEDVTNPATFTYYPNPVENTLTLNAQNNIENVTMYNMLGQEVLRATPNNVDSELDMSNLQDGTYFVKVTIASITKVVRVIKR